MSGGGNEIEMPAEVKEGAGLPAFCCFFREIGGVKKNQLGTPPCDTLHQLAVHGSHPLTVVLPSSLFVSLSSISIMTQAQVNGM